MEIRNYRVPITLFFLLSLVVANSWSLTQGNTDILHWIPLKCPLRWLTGFLCPTCGLGHALFYAWTFQWSESLAEHLFGLLVFFWIVSFVLSLWLNEGSYRSLFEFQTKVFRRLAIAKGMITLIALYSLWGVARNFI